MKIYRLIILFFVIVFLFGCSPRELELAVSPTIEMTETVEPTITPSPLPSSTPTITSSPTPIFPPIEGFEGTWVNKDGNTRNIKKLEIRAKDKDLYVRAWGACHIRLCDWGVSSSKYNGNPALFYWQGDLADHALQLSLIDGEMFVTLTIIFNDDRENQVAQDKFKHTGGNNASLSQDSKNNPILENEITPIPALNYEEFIGSNSKLIKFNSNPPDGDFDLDPDDDFDPEDYSEIDLDFFMSGDLLNIEKEYLGKRKVFSDDVIPADKLISQEYTKPSMYINRFAVTVKNLNFKDNDDYVFFSETRPIKILSFYKFYDPAIFEENGLFATINWQDEQLRKNQEEYLLERLKSDPIFWIVSWAYANPDGTVTIGHTFGEINDLVIGFRVAEEYSPREFRFLPGYKHTDFSFNKDKSRDFYTGYTFLENLYIKFPELIPDVKSIGNWINTGQMSEDLANDLFTMPAFTSFW